jgi:hypothetical protein
MNTLLMKLNMEKEQKQKVMNRLEDEIEKINLHIDRIIDTTQELQQVV